MVFFGGEIGQMVEEDAGRPIKTMRCGIVLSSIAHEYEVDRPQIQPLEKLGMSLSNSMRGQTSRPMKLISIQPN